VEIVQRKDKYYINIESSWSFYKFSK